MSVPCLQDNLTNDFSKHLWGELIDTTPFNFPSQQLAENIYYYSDINKINI